MGAGDRRSAPVLKWHRIFPLVCLALGAWLAAATGAGAQDWVSVADFESAEELARWQTRDLTRLERTAAWASTGASAAAATFEQWHPGREQWPAIILAPLPVSDVALYDVLELDLYNPQPDSVTVKLHLNDGASRAQQAYTVPPLSALAVRQRLRQLGGGLDLSAVRELHLYVTRPAQTFTVYVDNLRLRRDLPDQARALAADAGRLRDGVDAVLASLSAAVPPALAAGAGRAVSVRQRAEALAADSPGLTSGAQVAAARARLEALRTELTAARGVLPRLLAWRHAAARGRDDFALAVETSMRKVFLEAGRLELGRRESGDLGLGDLGLGEPDAGALTMALGGPLRLELAGGERESGQVIAVPLARPLEGVNWDLGPIRGPAGAALTGSVRLVGYVDTEQPSYPVVHTGWWPDPLIDFLGRVDRVPAGEVLTLWVTVDAPRGSPAGLYRGHLAIWEEGGAPQAVEIEAVVRDFDLPVHTHLRTALSLRALNERLYPDADRVELKRRYEDWMLGQYYLNPGDIYAGGPPDWDAARLRELMALGLNAINLAYVNAPREPDFDAAAHWRRFERQMDAVEAYLPVVEEAGARDLCYIYCFDERPSEQLDVVFETAARVKMRFPDIEVMTTAYDATFGLERPGGEAVDIWVPLTPHFDGHAGRLAQARSSGRDIWWYICIGPRNPHANWFVEYEAIQARLLMGAMTARYEPGGFLYYAVNRWPLNDRPITGGPRTEWNPASFRINNGDGSVMCAGPDGPLATIRLENIRDGIEDYEYYLLLRRLLRERGESMEAGQVPQELVRDLAHYSQDPGALYAERRRVAEEIERLMR